MPEEADGVDRRRHGEGAPDVILSRSTPIVFAVLLLSVLLASCGTPAARPGLTGWSVPTATQAALSTRGVKAVTRAVVVFNHDKSGLTLDHPALKDGAVAVPLDGRVCYGANHADATLDVILDSGASDTLRGSFDFWFAPATPSLVLPPSIDGLAGEPLPLAVQVDSGVGPSFSYACSATLTVSVGGSDLDPIALPVPGSGTVTLPAMTASEVLRLGTKLVLGSSTRSADKLVSVHLVRPATLTLKVAGVDAAPVLVSAGSATVFNGSVSGQTVIDVAPGTYLVDGLPVDGYLSPDALEVTVAAAESRTIDLTYTPGPPPPAETGLTLLAPTDGSTIVVPTFDVSVDVADPAAYTQLQALFLDKGILTAWTVVPTKSHYSATLTLNPDLYNGPHTLLLRAQRIDGSWVDGPSAAITIDVPWLGSAFLDFEGFPATVKLYPNRTLTLTGTVKSRNGFEGPGTLGATAPAGVGVTVSPTQHTFANGESIAVTVTIQTAIDLRPQTYDLGLTWADQYDLRFGTEALQLDVPNPLAIALATPASPVRSRPVQLTATLPVDETDVSDVEFFDGTTSLGKDTSAPYTLSWDPGLLVDGAHDLSATVHSPHGFTATSAVTTLDLRFPFGVRQEKDAGQALTLEPVTLDGAVFTGGGTSVVRIAPADLTLTTSTALPGTIRDLFGFAGKLYAAGDDALTRIATADLTQTPVSVQGSGYCCHASSASHGYVAYGSVVNGLDQTLAIDVGSPILALGADATTLMVATDGELLAFTATGDGPIGRAPIGYASLKGMALGTDTLQLLDGTALLARPRLLNVLADSRALDAPSWSASNLDLTANAVAGPGSVPLPDAGTTAETLAPSAGLADGTVSELAQTVDVVAGASYTLSFWYLPENGALAPSYRVGQPGGADIVAPTAYWSAAPTGWTRITTTFTVPAGVTSVDVVPFRTSADAAAPWPAGADVAVWGVRLDYGTTAGAEAPDVALGSGLCGALTTATSGQGAWWLGDAGGCVTRADPAGSASRVWDGAAGIASVLPVASDRTLVAQQDGDLVALSTSNLEATPVASEPLGFGVNGDELVVAYADGTVRRLDGPVWP